MSEIQRIDLVQARTVMAEHQDFAPQRLSLFTNEAFERVTTVQLGGTRVDIPHMNASDQATAAQLFSSVPVEKQATVQGSFDNLASQIHNEGKNNLSGIQAGSFSAPLVQALGDSLEVYMTSAGVDQADQAVQGVLFGAMVGVEGDLGQFARDLQSKLDLSAEMRTDMRELEEELADWPDPEETREFSWREVEFGENGDVVGVTMKTGHLDKKQAETLLDSLEKDRATLGDFTETMKFDLQNMSQAYQQGLQTLSALLESQHKSLMAIINNTKA